MSKRIWAGLVSCGLVSSGLVSAPVMGQSPQATPKGPGKLIERQPLAAGLGLEDAAEASSIRYTSTDGVTGHGTVVVSGALFIPKGKRPAGGWPLIAWTHGTVGIGDDCAPSRQPRGQRDREYLNSWLKEGYAIVATDYQGLGTPGPHPYMDSRAAAYSALDSIRAVQGARLGIAKKVVIVGQSQGAAAAFATAGFAPSYAPKIGVRGTVATGVPYATGKAYKGNESSQSTSPGVYIALNLMYAQVYNQYDPKRDPREVVTDLAMPMYKAAENACFGNLIRSVLESGLNEKNAFKFDVPTMRKYSAEYLSRSVYPTLKLSKPVFIGSGTDDILTTIEMQRELVSDSCAAGSVVDAHEYKGFDHSTTVNRSFTDSRVFVKKVMAGSPIASSCKPGAS